MIFEVQQAKIDKEVFGFDTTFLSLEVPVENEQEDIISELDPDYIDCPFGIRVKPSDCPSYYYSVTRNMGYLNTSDCNHPRVEKAMLKNMLE